MAVSEGDVRKQDVSRLDLFGDNSGAVFADLVKVKIPGDGKEFIAGAECRVEKILDGWY